MSNTSQGPGWWLASDGKWYPPELWTGPPTPGSGRAGGPNHAVGLSRADRRGPRRPTYPARPRFRPSPRTRRRDPSAAGAAPYGGSVPPGYAGYGAASPYRPTASPCTEDERAGDRRVRLWMRRVPPLRPGHPRHHLRLHRPLADRRSNGQQKGDGMALAGIIVGFGWWRSSCSHRPRAGHNNNNNGVVGSAILLGQLRLASCSRRANVQPILQRSKERTNARSALRRPRRPLDTTGRVEQPHASGCPGRRCASRSSSGRRCCATTGAWPRRG